MLGLFLWEEFPMQTVLLILCWVLTHAEKISGLAAAAGVLWAVWVYYGKLRLERAKWLSSLYSKFYEAENLKNVRNTLDESGPYPEDTQERIETMVNDQDPDFTDYLNFFEFMAYLEHLGQLSEKDVKALFDYYLRNLSKHKKVREYIDKDRNGFGYLKQVLLRFPAEE
jgi:hypothetical protein